MPKGRYADALATMRALHARVAAGEEPETWLLTEHEPVVTLGRNAKAANVLVPAERLRASGVDLVTIERGGDATYHGPGQLVVYPIRRLERFREVRPLVDALERALIGGLHAFGIAATARPEHRGVYVGRDAIAAIGLAVKAMTSLHGIALNVSTALDYDRLILPCGMPGFGITSISRQLGRPVPLDEAWAAVKPALEVEFDLTFVEDFTSQKNGPAPSK